MDKVLNLKIGGQAGEGIKVTGLMLNRTLSQLGFFTFGYSEYPSLIRGGHNTYQLSVADEEIMASEQRVDLLIALDQETIKLHQKELHKQSLIIYDPEEFSLPKDSKYKSRGNYLPIELVKLAKEAGGSALMSNVVALGATLALFELSLEPLLKILEKTFLRKSQEIVDINQKAAQAGHCLVKDKFKQHIKKFTPLGKSGSRMVLTANEAAGLGALAGGLKFYSAYPMTPATSILHYLVKRAAKQELLVKQTGDEISAINMALGASFAGVRAMTATSGGGLCLMAEGISFAGVAELPIVIINAMRVGPGLGIPTWTAQADLQFVLHIGHDEFPRIVLAPGDAQEAFVLTKKALIWAEKYQLPVIVLMDKHLSESDFSCQPFPITHSHQRLGFTKQAKEGYKRYQLSDNGVSLRTIPGQKNGLHIANSYEHDELGFGTEDGQQRTQQMDKRNQKLASLKKEMPLPSVFNSQEGGVGLISWGSTKGAVNEAIKDLSQVSHLHLNCLWPFPVKAVKEFVEKVEQILVIEGNSQGQLSQLIREQTGIEIKEQFLKYDGRPFYPEEIEEKVKKLIK